MLKFVFIKAYAGTGLLDSEVYTSLLPLIRSIRQDPSAIDYAYYKCRLAFKENQPYTVDNYIIIKKSLNHFSRNGKQ